MENTEKLDKLMHDIREKVTENTVLKEENCELRDKVYNMEREVEYTKEHAEHTIREARRYNLTLLITMITSIVIAAILTFVFGM